MREHIKEFVKLCIDNFNTPEAFKSLLKRFHWNNLNQSFKMER